MADISRDARMRFLPKWPQELRRRAEELFAAGHSVAAIAKTIKVPQATVYDWLEDVRRSSLPEPKVEEAAPLRPRPRRREPVKHLRVLIQDGLELAELLAGELRRELADTGRSDVARERSTRLFAALTTHARQLAKAAIDLERITEQRARKRRGTDDEQAPARSLAEIREEFARRLQAIYGGRELPGGSE